MDETSILASLISRITSTNTNADIYSAALNEIERGDSRSKVREVIYIDDSPLNSTSSAINGETPGMTPCPSIHEDDDNSSVQEVFLDNTSVTGSFRPPVVHIEDDLEEEIESESLPSSSETSSLNLTNSSSTLKPFQESDINQTTCSPVDEHSLQNVSSKKSGTEFTVPCLDSITSLKSQFESKYELHLGLRKVAGCHKRLPRSRMYKFKKDLHQQLDEWEKYLNEQSPSEAYIAVENTVDNEGPPRDFTYITHNLHLQEDVRHVFNNDFLVGCSCERICTIESCDCPRNSGGQFAYDRNGRVRVKPGTPIYECNSRCPCGMSCRNRVLQRGRTVKVAIFRTPNGCGWGVKTMETIEKHQLVTEYVGEAITQEEAEERGKVYDSCGQTYLFDLDFNEGECLYTLDAKKFGNISHFINHSCDPNLDVYAVWVDTLDPNFPRIAFFANRKIKVGEELTFDYQMTVSDVGGNSPRKKEHIKCHCGAKNCREYLC